VNAQRLGLANIRVITPDEVPPDVRLAAVYSNPPIRIGKPALHELLLHWLALLSPDGVAYLVLLKSLGSDSMQRWLNEVGYACVRLASEKGARILMVTPRDASR